MIESDVPLIRAFLIMFLIGSLFGSLNVFTDLRIYFRTGMKTFFWTGVGAAISTVGFGGLFLCAVENLSVAWVYIVFFALLPLGIIFGIVGTVTLWTRESGLWKEIRDKTTYWQWLTGNVPIVKYDQIPPLLFSKRAGITIGISLMTVGIIGAVFLKLIMNYFSASTIVAFIGGLLLVIFSIVYLNKGRK